MVKTMMIRLVMTTMMMTIMVIAKEKLKHSFCKKNPLRSIGTQTTLTKQSQSLVRNIDIFYFLHVDNLKSKKLTLGPELGLERPWLNSKSKSR